MHTRRYMLFVLFTFFFVINSYANNNLKKVYTFHSPVCMECNFHDNIFFFVHNSPELLVNYMQVFAGIKNIKIKIYSLNEARGKLTFFPYRKKAFT